MNGFSSQSRCTDAALERALTSYCFGELVGRERDAVEQHLLACDSCWAEFQRLEAAVRVLRFNDTWQGTAPGAGFVALMGLSSRLYRPFAGHPGFALAASALYGLLLALPVLVEVAYQFDRAGSLALTLSVPVWLWSSGSCLTALWLDVKATRSHAVSMVRPVLWLAGSTVLLCAALLPLLPTGTSVEASFQTYPVRLGYLKSVFYAWLVTPLFVLLPFHFVVAAQRELSARRHMSLLALLRREPNGVPPRGALFLRPGVLGLSLAALLGLNYLGVNHLFSNLLPGPYRTLFMALVLARVTVWLGLAALGFWWYLHALTELKREALAVRLLTSTGDGGEQAH